MGIGYDTKVDQWASHADYTRFHTKTFTSAAKKDLYPSIFSPYGHFNNQGSTKVAGRWKMHLDMLDVVSGRPFYQGTQMTVAPAAGLRALLLNQNLKVNFVKEEAPHGNSLNSSRSWAIGPKAVINAEWVFWNGFRIDSVIGTSLLYTRYTTLLNEESYQTGETTFFPSSTVNKNLNAVRSTMDLGLGLGFCSYAMDNKLLFDLSARYDFAQFYSQNMMRSFASQSAGLTGNGDLSMHGLTLNLRCDF